MDTVSPLPFSLTPCYDRLMDDLLRTVRKYVLRHELLSSGETVVVGVSGGPDSLCLLHLLRCLTLDWGLRLCVAHLNHGLRGAEADADARFVAGLAREWGLYCTIGAADVRALAAAPGLSLEEAARQARYRFLAEVARSNDAPVVAVGHNADDQAETVLMHFLRGSGVAGLRGMLPITRLADYRLDDGFGERDRPWSGASAEMPRLVRPLLTIARAEIVAYCAANALRPRFDRSNEDTTLYRNRLRHTLLPLLADYNPAIRSLLTRTAEVMAGDHEVLRSALENAWSAVARPAAAGTVTFDLAAWRMLPIGLQRATVREAIHRLRRSLRNINWEHVEPAVWCGRIGQTGQIATLPAGLSLQVDYDELRFATEGPPRVSDVPQVRAPVRLNAPGLTFLDDDWRVIVTRWSRADLPITFAENRDPWTAWLDADVVGAEMRLRSRAPGDRFRPQGMAGHSAKVNEFMINAKAPRHARAGWPILTGAVGIAWVCGLRVDERALVWPTTTAVWEVRFVRNQ